MYQVLQEYFGFSEFRPGQQQVVSTLLAGRSAAAIFPTGSGKSLCYQLPAIVFPHLTLVVSPLLALIDDQLSFLASKGIPAASIDSSQSRQQTQVIMRQIKQGKIKILMISVERFNNERFREFIGQIPISLLVVDEAHCISEWGHNFRPDYLKLPQYQQALAIPQVLLLTATATPKVIEDMGRRFQIPKADIVTTGFYRANLNLHVQGVNSQDKDARLIDWLNAQRRGDGIIYVTLQQSAERLADRLNRTNIRAQAYHAGMPSEQRQQIQQDFMTGKCPIIVATIAFGMGVDKSNINFVVHYDLPKSIENYAQEIGRAGRNGQRAECLVLANRDNLTVLQNFVYGDTPDSQGLHKLVTTLAQAGEQGRQWELTLHSLSMATNIRLLSLKTALVYLEMLGLIKPAYSYFAEYRFKLLCTEEELVDRFNGERRSFVAALLASATKAKIWYSLDFERLNQAYPSERSRVISAIEYFEEKGLIELQTKQITEVYSVLSPIENIDSLTERLHKQFQQKEASEIARIQAMLSLLSSDTCLSRRLSSYFGDNSLTQNCGHCSVCVSGKVSLPESHYLPPLSGLDFSELSREIWWHLASHLDATHSYANQTNAHQNNTNQSDDIDSDVLYYRANMLARALCGLTTPIFTRLKLRQKKGFASLEAYPFAEVRQWCWQQLSISGTSL
ncbi:RecQ family ATP-dependent DNA helicase [Shewanella sp. AS1]|uniref:RecQ family ATP-dependent DNA helicase n=1 Tax=Shewanella sp. AS1 TaxID=2907626 RepID=UPI001F348549|nr:RecQ family ATP-dependent DNA helicase [Shewanella sp. AS1]MCE9678436.1 RecQ family ATP-dependent DNA helicase [Shewanella sp. AS1]